MGLSELVHDPRFEHRSQRLPNKDQLMATLQRTFLTKPTDEWLEIVLMHGIPAGPVGTIDRVLNDPHVQERGMVKEVYDPHHPELGGWLTTGDPIEMSATAHKSFTHPPGLGEQSGEILREILGYAPEQVALLHEHKVI
jgi:CoA:oxalate CoA-transferase